MKLYASELMELARKEPEKYEGKRYKVVDGAKALTLDTGVYKEVTVVNGYLKTVSPTISGFATAWITSFTELEEIPPELKPVPFMEAVKAYSEGKTMEAKWNGTKSTYKNGAMGFGIKDEDGIPICASEILHGVWTIKE